MFFFFFAWPVSWGGQAWFDRFVVLAYSFYLKMTRILSYSWTQPYSSSSRTYVFCHIHDKVCWNLQGHQRTAVLLLWLNYMWCNLLYWLIWRLLKAIDSTEFNFGVSEKKGGKNTYIHIKSQKDRFVVVTEKNECEYFYNALDSLDLKRFICAFFPYMLRFIIASVPGR